MKDLSFFCPAILLLLVSFPMTSDYDLQGIHPRGIKFTSGMDLGMCGQSELLKITSWTPWKTVGQFRIYYQKLYVACVYVISIFVHMWVYLWYVWGCITVLHYIFSYIFRHSPGNSGRNSVFCLCATTTCCAKLSCCILCTPLCMLGPPLRRESHGTSLGPPLPVCQELPSAEPDPERVLCTCSLPARGRAPMLQNAD